MTKRRLSLVVAMSKNRVIGFEGKMPWGRLPRDLRWFRHITEGHPVIMGRKTFESIGKPLPGRTNIILSRDHDYDVPDGCVKSSSMTHAISTAYHELGAEDVFVIGGEEVYKKALKTMGPGDRIYMTEIDALYEGDVHFPDMDEELRKRWTRIKKIEMPEDEANKHGMTFLIYERKDMHKPL